ncbi:hypothetical protein OS493_032296 [Desmophyllum pertusum]|uniref:Uncharacterized protein n=1 Tax=Desmophyllum pertusum TaxID=174260 RepID=A0A9X0CPA9_9CNID|nr:hypothetical protein OS493_032296 [Desmophyllum pertusum]
MYKTVQIKKQPAQLSVAILKMSSNCPCCNVKSSVVLASIVTLKSLPYRPQVAHQLLHVPLLAYRDTIPSSVDYLPLYSPFANILYHFY